ncbi:MAG: hypothetical protein ABI665_13625 [Vicinamibacterales bacterium]
MTKGNKTALTLGLVGALGLGFWVGGGMATWSLESGQPAAAPIAKPAPLELTVAAPKTRAVRSKRSPQIGAMTTPTTPTTTRTEPTADAITASSITATSPNLHARLKTVLNRGANLSLAGTGFRDGEQFATIAHAARNTEVPFMLLKHRVLDEGKSLADAISESKPGLDAAVEAERARSEARADLEAISSN